jgi:hypothetical protein
MTLEMNLQDPSGDPLCQMAALVPDLGRRPGGQRTVARAIEQEDNR